MEAGLKQNKIEALNAASWSFKITTESLLKWQQKNSDQKFKTQKKNCQYKLLSAEQWSSG